jgi:D-alanyl-D-alanine carboxypeptidase
LPGAVLGVAAGGRAPVVLSTGDNDPATHTAMTPNIVMPIASVTKTFVAAIILQLQQEGRLQLDDHLAKYVDWPNGDHITLRELLRHTSGLPSLSNSDDQAEWTPRLAADLTHVWSADEALGYIRDRPPLFAPGADFHYSNGNYIVLGRIIETVTGHRLGDEIHDRLTTPLRLDDTVLDDGKGPTPAAIPHLFDDLAHNGKFVDVRPLPRTAVVTLLGAAGGMLSTPRDLLAWTRALWGSHKVIDARSQRRMLDFSANRRYGFAAYPICPCTTSAGTTTGIAYGHDGEFPGFRTFIAYDPTNDTAVVVGTNQSPAGNGALEDIVRRALAAR